MNQDRQIKVVLGVILVILAVGASTLIFYQNSRYSDVFFEYNGFAVQKIDRLGITEYQVEFYKEGNSQPFIINSRYNLNDLEEVEVYEGLREDLVKEELYVTMEPTLTGKATIAFSEINKYLENPNLFNLPTFPGLLTTLEGNDLPEVTCEDVSDTKGVIRFDIGVENRIYREDNGCVILEAKSEDDLIKVADRLSLTTLGVLEV